MKYILVLMCFITFSISGLFASGETETTAKNDIELRFAWWGNTSRHEKHEQIVALFEESNPSIKIIREPASWGDYWTKLATQSASGNSPDIMTMHLNESPRYAKNGILTDLQPLVDKGIIDLSKWSQGAIDTGRDFGKLTRLSEGENNPSLWVNVSLVEKYGLDMPDFEMSWDEWKDYFIRNQKKLPEGLWMSQDCSYTYNDTVILAWHRQKRGSAMVDLDDNLLLSKEDLMEFETYWEDLRQAGAVMPIDVFAEFDGVPRAQDAVVTERLVVAWNSSNQIVLSQDMMDSELQLFRLPTMPQGKNKYGEWTSGAYLSISDRSKNKEAAAEFANFFVNDWSAQDIFNGEHGRPANNEIASRLADRSTPLQKSFFELTSLVLDTAPLRNDFSKYHNQIVASIKNMGESIAYKSISVEEGVDQFLEDAKLILE